MQAKSTLLIFLKIEHTGKIIYSVVNITARNFNDHIGISDKSHKILLLSLIQYGYSLPIIRGGTVFCLENRVDMSIYFNRLHSFATWPNKEFPVSFIRLAQAGFFYTGSQNIVKCFCCGLSIYEWSEGDTPITIHKRMSPKCEFIQQPDERSQHNGAPTQATNHGQSLCRNTISERSDLINGVGANLRRRSVEENTLINRDERGSTTEGDESMPRTSSHGSLSGRLESYRRWNHTDMQNPRFLAEAGFYYSGEGDGVRCFCCNIGIKEWDKDDDPWVEHAKHRPSCRYLRKKRGNDFVDSVQSSLRQIYSPKQPSFSNHYLRLQTYLEWPSELQQTPEQLSAAGFYYTGTDDVVRCHYCDGGLRNWEQDDDPWIEHARWFPFCKYVVKIKGTAFIEDVRRNYEDIYTTQSQEQHEQSSSGESCNHNHHSRTGHCQLNEVGNVLQTPAAQSLIQHGYHRRSVLATIQEFFKRGGECSAFTAENLFAIIMEKEEKGENCPSDDGIMDSAQSNAILPDSTDFDPFQHLLLCRTCKQRERNIVFIPCGHRETCDMCCEVPFCPMCGAKVDRKIKTYLS